MKLLDYLKDLRTKSLTELKEHKLLLLRTQFNLRMQNSTKQLKQNHYLKMGRRSIARVCTIISEKV